MFTEIPVKDMVKGDIFLFNREVTRVRKVRNQDLIRVDYVMFDGAGTAINSGHVHYSPWDTEAVRRTN